MLIFGRSTLINDHGLTWPGFAATWIPAMGTVPISKQWLIVAACLLFSPISCSLWTAVSAGCSFAGYGGAILLLTSQHHPLRNVILKCTMQGLGVTPDLGSSQ